MTIENIIKSRTMNDEVYLSDVHRWIGLDLPLERARELQRELTKIQRGIYGKDQ